jgi:hypothetical protein
LTGSDGEGDWPEIAEAGHRGCVAEAQPDSKAGTNMSADANAIEHRGPGWEP